MTLLSGESLNIYIYTRQPLHKTLIFRDPVFSSWHHSKNGTHACFETFYVESLFTISEVNHLPVIVFIHSHIIFWKGILTEILTF